MGRDVTSKRGPRQKKLLALTGKQRLFVAELTKDPSMSPTEAARRAGYKNPNASANALLNNPTVRRATSVVINRVEEECNIDRKMVVQYLYHALMHDPLSTFTVGGDGSLTMKALDEIPIEVRRLINKIKCRSRIDKEGNPESVVEIEWINKNAALEMCAKHVGLFEADNKIKVTHDVKEIVTKIRDTIAGGGSNIIMDVDIDPNIIEGTVVDPSR